MANTYSAGIVTAYGAAVRGGYTGTYEEFCAQQAAFAENAEQVAEDRAAVEQIKTTFENQTVPAAVQQVNQAGAAQVQAVQAAGADEESDISAAGTAQVTAVQAAGAAQVTAVQSAGTTQVAAVNTAGSTQVQAVNAAGATQVDAVEDKGAEVIASIPQDYSALSGEVDDLKSAINEDLIGSIAWIDGYHAFGVGTDAYNLHADANYHCTNYFPVADGVFRYNGAPMSLNDLKSFTGSSSKNIVIFSKNGKIVGWYRNGNKENSDDGDGMSINFYGSNYTLLTVSPDYARLSDLYKRTEQNKTDIQFIANEIENNIMSPYYGTGANIFNKNDVVFNGEYYGDDGEVHQYQGYGYSKLIPINGGTTYYFSKPYYFNFYDSSEAFISGGHSSYDGNNTTAPQTAAYLRVSLTEANKDSMMVVANGLPSEYVPFAYQLSDGLKQDFSNLKICCIGDSLTQGVNGDTTDYDVTFIKENYPYYMGKTLKNTGILNYGRYGADPITWYNNYRSNFATPDGTYDAALIMLGTNGGISDTLDTDVEPYNSYSDYANTTCGCYCKIIEWLLDVTSNHICIVLVTPPTNWMADRPDKYTVVKNSVEVIKKIAARYSLPVIDVFNDSGISKYQSAIFRPYDGLHFCAKGYHKIGTFIGNQFMSIYSTFGNTDADTVTGGVNF